MDEQRLDHLLSMAQFPSINSGSDIWSSQDLFRAKAGGNWPGQSGGRIFTISPAVSGKTTWDLDLDGPFAITTYGEYTLTPTNTFTASAKLWGAGGGMGPQVSNFNVAAGGAGGYAGGTVQFTNGNSFKLWVGQGGPVTPNGNPGGSGTAFGGGGAAYNYADGNWNSGAGGGLSGIFITSATQANSVLIAGGGGGGGSAQSNSGAPVTGGAGGGTTGENGKGGSDGTGGMGGTQSAGGAGSTPASIGTAVAGSAVQGGSQTSSNTMGGGGGGGYFGGGSGIYGGGDCGTGGGGGSGYINTTYVTSGVLTAGSGTTVGNSSDTNRGTAGNAGTTAGSAGTNGKVVLI